MHKQNKIQAAHPDSFQSQGHRKQLARMALLLSIACSPLILLLFLIPGAGEWTVFLGRFHPALLHLPIGVLIITCLLELLNVLSRGKSGVASRLLILVCAFSTVATVVVGVLLAKGDAIQGSLAQSHLTWGVITGILIVLALGVRCLPQYAIHPHWPILYRCILLLSFVVLAWASHLGASITHGDNYLTEHLPWRKNPKHMHEPSDTKVLNPSVSYKHDVVPIFVSKCNSCHKAAYYKGELQMDSYEGLLKGGISGPGFVPGDIHASLVVARIRLPISNEEHMPPKNKPQITPEELEIIKQWIHQGAQFD